MSGLTRKTQLLFCGDNVSSPSEVIAQFGSLANSTPNFTSDPAVIQALAAWMEGWAGANITVGGQPVPPMQDMNGVLYVLTYQLAYILARGMSDWDTGTTYNTNDFCKVGPVLYVSQADANQGNNPATDSGANWKPYLSSSQSPSFIKAWAVFNGQTMTVLSGFNISSFTKVSTGTYTLGFAVPLGASGTPGMSGACQGLVRPISPGLSSFSFDTAALVSGSFVGNDYTYASVQFFSP